MSEPSLPPEEPTTRKLKLEPETRPLPPEEFPADDLALHDAALIVIAHPSEKLLGHRFGLKPGAVLVIGRDGDCDVSLAEVDSVSRRHAVVRHQGATVTLEDCHSTNGTWLHERRVEDPVALHSGNRFQVGSVHFKFLHDEDVEHAYHEAIYELVMRDGLTGLFNRRKFQEDGERECARALRYGRSLAMILFDIDHFKDVNDRFGHLRGDAVLARVAEVVRETLRREQFSARIGGEEFVVVCEETELEGALALAERLRERLAEAQHANGAEGFAVTCSFGVAAFGPPMTGLTDLMRAADSALYSAKQSGRNRVGVQDSRGAARS